ncbi:MAG: glycosyltransferase [Thaumarchaeota archaeon]|nr:glycosyltransferase [Nitrososphaerota archaeon]
MYQTSMSKGQELVAQRMVRYFRKIGHNAFLITSLYHNDTEIIPAESLPKDKNYAYSEDNELGIPVIRVNSYVSRWPPRRIVFRDFIHTLERIVNDLKLNVLITHSTLWNGPEDVVKFVEWRRSIRDLGGYQDPVVFCHMSHFQEPSPKRYSLLERSFRIAWNKISLPQIFRAANLLLVVTPYEEEAKVRMGANRDKCYLFPGGVDDESFLRFAALGSEEFYKWLNLKNDVKIVSYLGTTEGRKNPKAVIQIAEKLQHRQDIHFVIAGHGDSKYADGVKEAARRLSNVTYLGEVDEREKMLLIKASFLNIILSRLEALGLSQLEFMFQGVPVITSAVGGQSWLIRNDQEGMHVKGSDDIEGAAKTIEKLCDDPSLRDRLAANARSRASVFTFSKLIDDLDMSITRAFVRESGLGQIPPDVRSTLSEPEQVIKSWSSGSRRVVATDRRLFIQHGSLSRRVLELPYPNITSIEHIRRYPWKTLLIGSALTALMIVEPYLRPIFSTTLMARLEGLVLPVVSNINLRDPLINSLTSSINLQPEIANTLPTSIPMVPISVGLLFFILRARSGFALHGTSVRPVYLPRAFKQAVAYIRSVQDQTFAGGTKKDIERNKMERMLEK